MKSTSSYQSKLSTAVRFPLRWLAWYWRGGWWHRTLTVGFAAGFLCLGVMYGIARWYMLSQAGRPEVLGASFIPAYAESLGLDPQQTMDALIKDVGVRNFRLVSYWDQLEPAPGQYDFRALDWQFQKAEAAHANISLSIGLRQPRWPECHMPQWALGEPASQWQPQLNDFISAVVKRYQHSPSLSSYQLENEYFLKAFGLCTNFDRSRLVSEYNLVRRLDPAHEIIVARSQNALGIALGQPQPDKLGISIYKRVWGWPPGRYVEYPFPAWYFGFLAGWQKLTTGKDMMIHELQAEAWPPNGKSITEISLAEQNKSFNAKRFEDRLRYGRATGMHEMYLWGAEYWYYRLTVLHDPSVWNVAKQAFSQAQQ